MVFSLENVCEIPRNGKQGGGEIVIPDMLAEFIREVPLVSLLRAIAKLSTPKEDLRVYVDEAVGSYKSYSGEWLVEDFGFNPYGGWGIEDIKVKLFDLLLDDNVAVVIKSVPRYTVVIPNNKRTTGLQFVLKREIEGKTSRVVLSTEVKELLGDTVYKLTEEEIKKDFSWAWDAGFAKPVG